MKDDFFEEQPDGTIIPVDPEEVKEKYGWDDFVKEWDRIESEKERFINDNPKG